MSPLPPPSPTGPTLGAAVPLLVALTSVLKPLAQALDDAATALRRGRPAGAAGPLAEAARAAGQVRSLAALLEERLRERARRLADLPPEPGPEGWQ